MRETDLEYDGHAGRVVARRWSADDGGEAARYVALLVHGYGEHAGRYAHVAQRLVEDGAVVYANDHVGHGRSEGEPALVMDFQEVEEDVHQLESIARNEHPTLPVVLVGHSMGGLIAARYAQRWGDGLACTILSAPAIGSIGWVSDLLALDQIPQLPLDPTTLSRDPSVGEAYAADPLVWHGGFKRNTLEALQTGADRVRAAGSCNGPLLWLHGEEDPLVPIDAVRRAWLTLQGRRSEAKSYPGARHEIFNETNRDEVLDDVVAFIHAQLPAPSR